MAIAEYEKVVQSAFREVADALAAREYLDDQVRTDLSLLETEQEQTHQAAVRFEAGWSDRPTVLAAEIRLGQADLSCIQARETMALNWLDLYRAFYGTDTAG
jgi:multidrug efflux system outer membrane protein